MVHAAVAEAEPGEVLVLTMPEPAPVALVGELLATQAKGRGVAAMLVDAAVRDVEELREVGLADLGALRARPRRGEDACRARSASRSRSAARRSARATSSCSTRTAPWSSSRSASTRCWRRPATRAEREREKRAKLEAGELSYDLDGLRELVER